MKTWHFMLGFTVFGLAFVRLALRRAFCAPTITPPLPRWQELRAHAMHVALYAFLIVMLLLSWLTLSAKGRTIPWFGLELPALVSPDRALARSIQHFHETIGMIGYYLIGSHAAVALFHHYCMRDDAGTDADWAATRMSRAVSLKVRELIHAQLQRPVPGSVFNRNHGRILHRRQQATDYSSQRMRRACRNSGEDTDRFVVTLLLVAVGIFDCALSLPESGGPPDRPHPPWLETKAVNIAC